MNILIAGSSGLVGSALTPFLEAQGCHVSHLVRHPAKAANEITWNPDKGELDSQSLKGFDAVINLAGENIAAGRWTEARKKELLDSRVKSTKTLCQALASLDNPPHVLVNASAIGYYGHQGSKLLTEDSPKGNGFLVDICNRWEAATEAALQKGIRVVFARFGVVLSPNGGALAKMRTPFKWGLGGVLGSGKQYMSWIGIDDLVHILYFLLQDDDLYGPVNVVSPHPATNYAFTKTLGKVLKRPTFFAMPAFLVRLVFGEMGDEMLLSSARVEPKKLLEAGYHFRQPELESALKETE